MALWVGLISGTSADAVDAALVRIDDDPSALELVAFRSDPFASELRKRIVALQGGEGSPAELARVDRELGACFAESALRVIEDAGVEPSAVRGIGSHGQTVAHFPAPPVRATLQIGCAATLHARTTLPVVSDFRRADVVAGGEGAPLTPFFHRARFARDDETRAVLNLGGFSNVTWLGAAPLVAFDPGPANALIDRAAVWASEGAECFDRDGARARRGRADLDLVDSLLRDPYFARTPPKSTGHEHFDAAWFERARDAVLERGGGRDDVVATLTELTAASVARAAADFFPAPAQRWLVCGGGARNGALVDALRARLAPAAVETTDAHGVPADALEAMAFALLGWAAERGLASNVPEATGAERPVCLGVETPPGSLVRAAGSTR